MTREDISSRRLSYDLGVLSDDAPSDPMLLFDAWLREAVAAQDAGAEFEATAMQLTTARRLRGGMWQPSSRVVLLKSFDEDGFVYFTNYESRKGGEIARNPHVGLSFYWHPLQRQIRIEGVAERIDAADSEEYFATRPHDSQVSTWASPQSRPVDSREALDQLYRDTESRFGDEIPYPSHWGGYCVHPRRIEFWQGRTSRLHDRLEYTRTDGGWQRHRLAP